MMKKQLSSLWFILLIASLLAPAQAQARAPQPPNHPDSVSNGSVSISSVGIGNNYAITFTVYFESTVDYMDRFEITVPGSWTTDSVTPLATDTSVDCGNHPTVADYTDNITSKTIYWQTSSSIVPPTQCGAWDSFTNHDFVAHVSVPTCGGNLGNFAWLITSDGFETGSAQTLPGSTSVQCVSPLSWNGSSSTDWGAQSNWTPNFVPGSDADVTINSGTTYAPTISSDVTTGNLDVNNGAVLTVSGAFNLSINGDLNNFFANPATIDMGTGNLTVAGFGDKISTEQDVTGNADFTFLGSNGVVINPGGSLPLGLTSVEIRDHTVCTSDPTLPSITRCYFINPTNNTGRSATVTFYFDESHLNGLATDCNDPRADNLKAWHFKGTGLGWELAGGTGGTVTCNPGGISNVTVSGVTDFSAFVISTGNPTAITLNSLSAHPGSPRLPFVILPFALGLVFISGTLFLALKRQQTA